VEKLRVFDAARDPRVGYLLGVAHYHAGEPARAIELLAGAAPLLPADSPQRREAVQVLGLSHYLAGHVAESIPFLEQTRTAMPDSIDLAQTLATAYAQTGQAAKARESWARAFQVPADSAAGHLLAAQMMIRVGLEEMAEGELKQAVAKDPRVPRAHLLMGQTALFRGRLDEAVTLLKRELEVSPGDAMAFHLLGDAYIRQAKWDEALAALQKSIWINPYFSGPYILLGKAYMKKGDMAAGEGMLRQAVQYDPNNKAAHYLLGQLLQQTGRPDEARKELETAERLPGVGER
jgi:tetratricopeptide (TPR) repeat protein